MEENKQKDLIPVRLEIVKDVSGNSKISVVAEAKDTLLKMLDDPNHQKKVQQFKNEYNTLIAELKPTLAKVESRKESDSILYWKISDKIYNFLMKKAQTYGLFVTNYERTLARELNISPSRISYFMQFRRLYPTINHIDKSIKWSWYLELMKIDNMHKRKKLETMIKLHRIKDIKTLKELSN